MCKRGDTLSLRVLIGRGLDLLPNFSLSSRYSIILSCVFFSFEGFPQLIVGVYYSEGPPVPIPNTEVKLISVENTWRVTAWEDRAMPTF